MPPPAALAEEVSRAAPAASAASLGLLQPGHAGKGGGDRGTQGLRPREASLFFFLLCEPLIETDGLVPDFF